ncbi:CHAT domain-containing protein [Cyanobacteria bacterium FACHB-63]|nr:CHAT domain-containing protein [Cyanobacteria bacterium FACHB-63]
MKVRSILASFLLSLALFTGQDIARSQSFPAQLYQQGVEQYQSNQIDAALKSWQQALQQFRQLDDQQGEGATLGALSAGYLAIADHRKTIQYAQELLQIAKALNNQEAQAQALGNLGVAYKNLGNYSQSIESQQEALTIFRRLQNHQAEGQLLSNLGNTYATIGNYDQAIAVYEKSLAIAQQLNNLTAQGNVLSNLGAAYTSIGDDQKALAFYQQSLKIAESIQDLPLQVGILINLGTTHHVLGHNNLGIQYYQQGLTLAQKISDRRLQGDALGNLGLIYEDQKDYPKAIQAHQQSLAIAKASQDPRSEALARNNLAHAFLAARRLSEAETELRIAVKLLDQVRSQLSDFEQINIFDTQVSTYNLLQQVYVADNKPEAALEATEQGRVRAFAQLLATRFNAKKQLLVTPSIDKIRQIAKQQNATLVSYSIVPDELFKFRGKQRGREAALHIWVVQPTGKVSFRQVDLKTLWKQQTTLRSLVQSSLCLLPTDLCTSDTKSLQKEESREYPGLKELYQLLISPIEELLPKNPNQSIIFIPQESLFLVPFAALQNSQGKFLIEQHTILTAPSIQVLEFTHQQRKRTTNNQSVLIVGNPIMPKVVLKAGESPKQLPPLPGSEEEAQVIASLFKTNPLIGNQATKAIILPKLAKARFIHLATHGLLEYGTETGAIQKELPGAIALSPFHQDDGLLTSSEIFNLNLSAELVVLSACDTGSGRITGDGVIGLSRAWISTGVPTVIVSLRKVPDEQTSFLMTSFYQNLQRTPNKAQSLRAAMLETMQSYPDPIGWAAFTLIGESE